MIYPEAPDDGTTPRPTAWSWRKRVRAGVRGNGRPRTSAHPRAAYWRAYKRRRAKAVA